MKLIIQIPCFNEEYALPKALAALPRAVEGFDTVEWLVIDDGSRDRTVELARSLGVDHIVSFNANKGLAVAFQAGIDAALKLGADVIVNTDADNQYQSEDIPKLVAPILERKADVVIGDRQLKNHSEFSWLKRLLQRLGSSVVRNASRTDIPDTTSGFRAYTRDGALRLNVVSRFTYTLETLIQAGKSDMSVTHVPVRTNPKIRESRLFSSTWDYVKRSIGTILRISVMYEPLPLFMWLSVALGLAGAGLIGRFLWAYFTQPGPTGRVQSLVIGAALVIIALMLVLLGILGDLLRANRILIEQTLRRVRRIELSLGVPPDDLLDKGLRGARGDPPLSRAPGEASNAPDPVVIEPVSSAQRGRRA
jgi:glycosyltransferase involved in cell wall biosynthesis